MKTNFAQNATLAAVFVLTSATVLSRPAQAQDKSAQAPAAQRTDGSNRQDVAVPPGISIGAWEIPAPSMFNYSDEKQSQAPKKKGFMGSLQKGLSEAVDKTKQAGQSIGNKAGLTKYAHVYLNVKDEKGAEYQIHAMPVDAITGQLRNFTDLKQAQLRVVVLTKAEADEMYLDMDSYWKKHDYLKLPPEKPETINSKPAAPTLGAILDFAQSVNNAKLPYQMTTNDTSIEPLNDNAFAAGALSTAGVCAPDKCPALGALYSGFATPGVGNNLIGNKNLQPSPIYSTAAQTGATPSVLIMLFRSTNGVAPMPPKGNPAAAQAPGGAQPQ